MKRRRPRRVAATRESVAEFLARGGVVTRCPVADAAPADRFGCERYQPWRSKVRDQSGKGVGV